MYLFYYIQGRPLLKFFSHNEVLALDQRYLVLIKLIAKKLYILIKKKRKRTENISFAIFVCTTDYRLLRECFFQVWL